MSKSVQSQPSGASGSRGGTEEHVKIDAVRSGTGVAANSADGEAQTASPYNLAAEMAVLGALLFDNSAHQRVADILQAGDFYAPANQQIYEVSVRMISAGRIADGVTLREHFERDGSLSEMGGAQYLADLLDSAAFGPEITDYALLILDLSLRRSLIAIGSRMVSDARHGDAETDGRAQIEASERELFELAESRRQGSGFVSFASALAQTVETAAAAFSREGKIAGIATGLAELDRRIGGLHRSDLVIIAGRPSMGKTALATNIAFFAAEHCKRETRADGSRHTVEGAVVGFFSLEMSAEQLAMRILSDVTNIASHLIRRGEVQPRDYEALRDAAARLEALPLYIDDTGGISISQIAARARRLQRTHGLDLLIIDYLQLVAGAPGSAADGRVHEISRISQAMKALAKELNVPVIALSQLSRQVEMREDKRPQLSDLRDSGAIEQDADIVLFVFREAYYLERMEPGEDKTEAHAEWLEKMKIKRNLAELIVSKQRHGPIGKIDVAFDPNRVRFSNLERHYNIDDYAR